MRPKKPSIADRPAVISAGRAVVFVGALLAMLVPPVGLVTQVGWIAAKSAMASHDKANDKGRGHIGGSGGAGGPGGGGHDDEGHGGDTATSSGGNGGGGATGDAAAAEDAAMGGAIQSVEPAGRPPAGNAPAGLPTVLEIFALSDDAVVSLDEEKALIAGGWNSR